MEYFDGQVFDFFENDRFIRWVVSPDNETKSYWAKWMTDNPEKADILLKAYKIAKELNAVGKPLSSESLKQEAWLHINARIDLPEQAGFSNPSIKRRFLFAAAAVAGILLIAYPLYRRLKPDILIGAQTAVVNQKMANNIVDGKRLQRINNTSRNQIAYLVDGSRVTLQPGAKIDHTIFLEKDKREVFLSGDAFFDVAKDASRPFYVHVNDIILRVLGTSFKITTNKNDGNVTVVVTTGKVSVYKKDKKNQPQYILGRNEKIQYNPLDQRIVKSTLDSHEFSQNIQPEVQKPNFNFEATSVSVIFSTLEEAYGIHIQYDQDVFANLMVTTSLTDETFEQKLKIICTAVNARYFINGNGVFVSAIKNN